MDEMSDTNEQLAKIVAALHACKMSEPAKMGFGLMVQTLKSLGLPDAKARETAFEQLAKMVEAGELEIADNSLLVTEKGQQWLERERAAGHGSAN
jgi:hypothetical protein